MYLLIGVLLTIPILCIMLISRRRRKIICKICNMGCFQKYHLLNDIIEPFGFRYILSQDIFTSNLDALQREFGYNDLYDNTASYFNMVFDCEKFYFDYQNTTWRIEFWKGLYGINIGSEIGIYRADHIVPPEKRSTTHFHCISNEEMLVLSLELFWDYTSLFYINERHWWLTGFSLGRTTQLENLWSKVSITFPNAEMLNLFLRAVREKGYTHHEYYTWDLTVYIKFTYPHTPCPCHRHRWFPELQIRFYCRLFHWATKPFQQTMDQLLFLYFWLPFAFRRMCRLRIYNKKGRLF